MGKRKRDAALVVRLTHAEREAIAAIVTEIGCGATLTGFVRTAIEREIARRTAPAHTALEAD
jgi:hypothetical protein